MVFKNAFKIAVILFLAQSFFAGKNAFCVTGAEFSFGWQQLDATSFKGAAEYGASNYPGYNSTNDTQNKHFVFSLFGETNSIHRFGIRAGVSKYLNSHFRESYQNNGSDSEITAISIPLSIYYKYKPFSLYSLWIGAGAEWMKLSYFMPDSPAFGYSNNKFTNVKVLPHITAGLEIFLSKQVSIDFNLMYVFNAKFNSFTTSVNGTEEGLYSQNGQIITAPAGSSLSPFSINYSGFKSEIGIRIYFNPPN